MPPRAFGSATPRPTGHPATATLSASSAKLSGARLPPRHLVWVGAVDPAVRNGPLVAPAPVVVPPPAPAVTKEPEKMVFLD